MTLYKASEVSRKIDRSLRNKYFGLPVVLTGYILFCSSFAKVQELGLGSRGPTFTRYQIQLYWSGGGRRSGYSRDQTVIFTMV